MDLVVSRFRHTFNSLLSKYFLPKFLQSLRQETKFYREPYIIQQVPSQSWDGARNSNANRIKSVENWNSLLSWEVEATICLNRLSFRYTERVWRRGKGYISSSSSIFKPLPWEFQTISGNSRAKDGDIKVKVSGNFAKQWRISRDTFQNQSTAYQTLRYFRTYRLWRWFNYFVWIFPGHAFARTSERGKTGKQRCALPKRGIRGNMYRTLTIVYWLALYCGRFFSGVS